MSTRHYQLYKSKVGEHIESIVESKVGEHIQEYSFKMKYQADPLG